MRETLAKLEAKVRGAPDASETTKAELLALLRTLQAELEAIEPTHGEQARRIAGGAWAAAAPEEAEESLSTREELEESLREFEMTHPRLYTTVSAFLKTLSDAGI